MQASENAIRQSNEMIKKATLGLLGVFSLFLILFTINKGLVTGDIGLGSLRKGSTTTPSGTSQGTVKTGEPITTTKPGATSSASCEAPNTTIAKLSSSNGICSGVQCRSLSGCSYEQYLPIIKDEASKAGIDYRIAVVIMCRESRAIANPPQRTGSAANADGSYDCGLMQINRKNKVCEPEILDPRNNIRAGIQELKNKIVSASKKPVIPGVPALGNAFADYNCCAGPTVASSPSSDCTEAAGFPTTIPKWACPINPGGSTYNMCAVKDYACESISCINSVR